MKTARQYKNPPDFITVHNDHALKPLLAAAGTLGTTRTLEALIGLWEPWPTDLQCRHDIQGPLVDALREALAAYEERVAEFLKQRDRHRTETPQEPNTTPVTPHQVAIGQSSNLTGRKKRGRKG